MVKEGVEGEGEVACGEHDEVEVAEEEERFGDGGAEAEAVINMLVGETEDVGMESVRLAHVLVPSHVADVWYSQRADYNSHVCRCARCALVCWVGVVIDTVYAFVEQRC